MTSLFGIIPHEVPDMAGGRTAFDLTGLTVGVRFWGCTSCWSRASEAPSAHHFKGEVQGVWLEQTFMTGCPTCEHEIKEYEVTGEGTGTRLVDSTPTWPVGQEAYQAVAVGFAEAGL